MDNPTFVETRQNTLTATAEGTILRAPALKMGVPVSANIWQLLALQGRMFNLKQATIGTAIAGSAQAAGAIVLTAPTVRFTVPTGTTVFPRHFNLSFAAQAGTDNEIAVCYSQTDSYSSGGTAVTPLNWRTDNPRATAVTSCYVAAGAAVVEAALTNVRAIYQEILPLAVTYATNHRSDYVIDKHWDDLIPIVGPASFLVFFVGATTTPTGYFILDWAEVPSVSAV